MHFPPRSVAASMLRNFNILSFLFFLLLVFSSLARAEEVPSVEPMPGAKTFREQIDYYTTCSLFYAPSLALLNSKILLRSNPDRQSQQTRSWVLGSQSLAFAGLGALAARKLFISPSLIVSTGLLTGAAGYLLAKQALDGNRGAGYASVVIPVAPIVTISIIFMTADYHF